MGDKLEVLQAEKKAKLKEKERERKKRAAERKKKDQAGAAAAAQAEISAAAAEAAALSTRWLSCGLIFLLGFDPASLEGLVPASCTMPKLCVSVSVWSWDVLNVGL